MLFTIKSLLKIINIITGGIGTTIEAGSCAALNSRKSVSCNRGAAELLAAVPLLRATEPTYGVVPVLFLLHSTPFFFAGARYQLCAESSPPNQSTNNKSSVGLPSDLTNNAILEMRTYRENTRFACGSLAQIFSPTPCNISHKERSS